MTAYLDGVIPNHLLEVVQKNRGLVQLVVITPERMEEKMAFVNAEEMAKSLVENLSEPFKPEKYDDTYRKELLDLIRAKAAGQPLPEPAPEQEGEVVDLLAALRESVERTKRQRRAPSKRKAS